MQNIKEYIENKKLEFKEQLVNFDKSLVIMQVGHVPASDRYVKNKLKDCAEIGLASTLIPLPEEITEDELIAEIKKVNIDSTVGGLIVQLPLPKHINEERIKLAVAADKDVDGFNICNKKVAAATPSGIMMYLEDQNFEFEGKNAVILGRSNIVGKPMHDLLLAKNMNVINLHSYTSEEDKRFYLAHADLIIVAVGKVNTLTANYQLKPSTIIMDVGINVKEDGKLIGDCEKDLPVAFQSPVPGGVGLLTRLALVYNLISLYK